MKKPLETTLAEITEELRKAQGPNLVACYVYGSAVRGNAVEGISDINLLIVLEKSDATAHQAIAQIFSAHPEVDPFILPRSGLERTMQCFASKFASIKRNYRVLHGADLFKDVQIDPHLERLICEQALRNLRLRLSYAFVTATANKPYDRFLHASISAIFIQLSDVLRLSGREIPKDFAPRIPLIEQTWISKESILTELLELRQKPRQLDQTTATSFHRRTLTLLDAAIGFIETNWSAEQPDLK
jgi:predicted nucleotidyltransferase